MSGPLLRLGSLALLFGLIVLGGTADAAGIGLNLRGHTHNIPQAVAGGRNPRVGVGAGEQALSRPHLNHPQYPDGHNGRKCGDQIAQMRDRRELLTSIGASRPQGEMALRLQFGDPDHAAAICGNKARQQISQPDILGFHGWDFMMLPHAANSIPALEN